MLNTAIFSKNSPYALAIALAVACASVYGQAQESIVFKSTPFNVSVERFLQLNPEFTCEPSARAGSGTCISERSTYGGIDARKIFARFLEGRLSNVEIEVVSGPDLLPAANAFMTIRGALLEKYGPAPAESDKSGGLESTYHSWRRDGLTLSLSRSTNGTSHLIAVMIGRDDHWQRSIDLRKARAKKDV